MNEKPISEQDKNASIEYILAQGLIYPQTARERISDMVRTIGFRYIFWDTWYSLFFATVTLAGVLFLFAVSPDSYRYTAAVATAPLLFLLITAFAEISERLYGLYELKQTCRYTIRQVTTIRTICYSIAGTVFTVVIAAMSAKELSEFLSLFALCLSALFVCAALSLTALRFSRNTWAVTILSALWVFANVALSFTLSHTWETLLQNVPIVITAVIALISIAVFVYQISKMLSEENKYAVA